MSEEASRHILQLTATIVAAHVARNEVAPDTLPSLIQSVYRSLVSLGNVEAVPPALVPAVPVKQSVFADYLVCLEDGKTLKTLKRHLRSRHGLTPEQYRAKWGLPAHYPMVAPSYAATRSALARESGLGHKPAAEPVVTLLPKRRGKGSKR